MLSTLRMSASRRLSQLAGQTRNASTMKEAVVGKGTKVTIQDVPIPKAGPHQVVTKVVFSGSNPKDWKRAEMPNQPAKNQGDDISGVVHEVGDNVSEFKPGDRVMAFHEMMKPGGSYAEYALSWEHTTAHLPENMSFEEGAAIPLASLTAAIGLFARLRLPEPWLPATKPTPLIIYGAASAVGSYAIQLAQRANIHPLICVAGKSRDHIEKYISREKGDTIIDYRKGPDAIVAAFQKVAQQHGKIEYAFDAVSEKGSYQNICKVLSTDGGRITNVLPGRKYDVPEGVVQSLTTVGRVHGVPDDLKDFGYVYFRYFAKGLQEGWFKPQPQEVRPGVLEGIQEALVSRKEGEAKAVKYVFRIEDTPGVG
ncbi:Trans-enoyl reductase fsr4 [Fulvia fulva]|uniref:Trans-enoyl reductase fsr4 n=1 Tax=Passalora fulva TaxID=5499 RepID=A0A9Q8LGD8_PASFU|nr:Trans-enoyl reductase fsr4 [Fulvia fulva]UJO16908.1 Trans-enoyl reductase fsr4 [Fulvia fulva]